MADPKVDEESESKDIDHNTAKEQDQSVAVPGSKEGGLGGDAEGAGRALLGRTLRSWRPTPRRRKRLTRRSIIPS